MTDLFPIIWSDFHFLRPQYLWGFVGVGVILILGLLSTRENARWKKHIAPHLRPFVISKGSLHIKIAIQFMLALGLTIGVLALAGPTWKKIEMPGQTLETPVVILLDLSQSMLAEDIQPSRLERAKFKITDFLNANPGARVALIGFAGTAHTIVPLTRDYKIIKSHIETLTPKVMPFRGSDLKSALILADSAMSTTSAPGTIVVFSDDYDESIFDWMKDYASNSKNSIAIMPMNTSTGADVPNYSGHGSLRYKGKNVHSALNAAVVSKLNSLENIQIHQLTLDKSDVDAMAKTIRMNLKFTEAPKKKENEWRDVGFLFIIPMAFILLLWFRKGWVVFSLFGMLSLTSCQQENSHFADLWFTKDYQGQRFMKKGDYAKAAKTYQDPLRQGVAYFKAGNYDEAIKAFNNDTTAMGAYNLGLAYFKNGDYAAAQMAFGIAVQLNPTMEEAQQNKHEMERLLNGMNEASLADAEEAAKEKKTAKTKENDSQEDFSGGGQKATKKDMEKERLSEMVNTEIQKAKELDEVPDDLSNSAVGDNSKVLLRKINDDPARFLMKKLEYQVKKNNIKPQNNEKPW